MTIRPCSGSTGSGRSPPPRLSPREDRRRDPGPRPVGERPRWVPVPLAAAVSAVVLGPALGRGVVLAYDLAWSPDPRWTPFSLGLGTPAPRAVPSDALGVALGHVVGAGPAQAMVLLAILTLAGWGTGRLARGSRPRPPSAPVRRSSPACGTPSSSSGSSSGSGRPARLRPRAPPPAPRAPRPDRRQGRTRLLAAASPSGGWAGPTPWPSLALAVVPVLLLPWPRWRAAALDAGRRGGVRRRCGRGRPSPPASARRTSAPPPSPRGRTPPSAPSSPSCREAARGTPPATPPSAAPGPWRSWRRSSPSARWRPPSSPPAGPACSRSWPRPPSASPWPSPPSPTPLGLWSAVVVALPGGGVLRDAQKLVAPLVALAAAGVGVLVAAPGPAGRRRPGGRDPRRGPPGRHPAGTRLGRPGPGERRRGPCRRARRGDHRCPGPRRDRRASCRGPSTAGTRGTATASP